MCSWVGHSEEFHEYNIPRQGRLAKKGILKDANPPTPMPSYDRLDNIIIHNNNSSLTQVRFSSRPGRIYTEPSPELPKLTPNYGYPQGPTPITERYSTKCFAVYLSFGWRGTWLVLLWSALCDNGSAWMENSYFSRCNARWVHLR